MSETKKPRDYLFITIITLLISSMVGLIIRASGVIPETQLSLLLPIAAGVLGMILVLVWGDRVLNDTKKWER